MNAEVFVLDHDALRLRERSGSEDVLLQVGRGRAEALTQIGLLPILRDRQAQDGADVDARVALDAERVRKYSLDVAIEAALDLPRRLLCGEAQFHLDVQLLESLDEVGVLHLLPLARAVVVAVAPLVDAHLRTDEVHPLRRPLRERNALTKVVDADRRLMRVLDRPDDVERTPRRVSAEEDAGPRALVGDLVDDGRAPLVELDPDVALDPRKRSLLADREDDVGRGEEHGVDRHLHKLAAFF